MAAATGRFLILIQMNDLYEIVEYFVPIVDMNVETKLKIVF